MFENPVYLRLPTENDQPYFANPSSAEVVMSVLVNAQKQGWLRLHGFVVLPDALEMVTTPIKQGVSGMVAYLQAETIPLITVLQPQTGLVWTSKYITLPLKTRSAMEARLRMMHLAPVANGITETAEAFPYSSANPRYTSTVVSYAGFTRQTSRDDTQPDVPASTPG